MGCACAPHSTPSNLQPRPLSQNASLWPLRVPRDPAWENGFQRWGRPSISPIHAPGMRFILYRPCRSWVEEWERYNVSEIQVNQRVLCREGDMKPPATLCPCQIEEKQDSNSSPLDTNVLHTDSIRLGQGIISLIASSREGEGRGHRVSPRGLSQVNGCGIG